MQSNCAAVHLRIAGLLTVAVLLAGCKPLPTPPTPRPHEGKVLRVACPDAWTEGVLNRFGKAWARAEGIQLEVLRYQRGSEAPPAADVWIVAPADMPRWAAAGQLLPVPEGYRSDADSYGWKKLLPMYRQRLLVWDHSPCALPLVGEAPLCFYRKDLYSAVEQREAFRRRSQKDLVAPTTWEEFAEQAEFFKDRWGKPALPPLPENDEDLDREFHSVAAPLARMAVRSDVKNPNIVETFSFHYDIDTGEPRLESPGFIAALALLQRFQACRPPGTHPSPPEAFRDGQAALCIADARWIVRFHEGKVGRDFGICPVPGSRHPFPYRGDQPKPVPTVNRVPYLGAGGWLGVVPAPSREPEAAFALLAELSSREKSQLIVMPPDLGGAGVTRSEQLDNATGWLAFDLDAAQTQELEQAIRRNVLHVELQNPLYRLRTPDQAEHLQALLAEVRAVLLKGAKPREALAAATERWRALDARQREKTHKREYQMSLGLHGQP